MTPPPPPPSTLQKKLLSKSPALLELSNCETNLGKLVKDCIIFEGDGVPTFTITDTILYVPVITFSTQDKASFLQQLKSGFKGTINL